MLCDVDFDLIIGCYIFNLVLWLFILDCDFIQEIWDLVFVELFDEIFVDYDIWFCECLCEMVCMVFIELLVW